MADLVVVDGIGYKRRNPWGVFLLSFVTLGVYFFVWWYKINNELRHYGIPNEPARAVLAVTLGALIIVPPFVSIYNTADRISQAQKKSGAEERLIPVLGLLLFLVIEGFTVVYYQSQINKVWDQLAVQEGATVHPA
jgi:drug/metabolite transporter (DMT)-like permease